MLKKLIGLILISITLAACKNDVSDTAMMTTLTEQDTITMKASENVTETEAAIEETTEDTLRTKYGIVTEEFSEEELAEILRLMKDEELFQKYFVDVINAQEDWYAQACHIKDGPPARLYATSYETEEKLKFYFFIGEDGSIYMQFENEDIGFLTNVDGVTEIPTFAIF